MEKAIVFGPIIIFFGFFGLLVIGFFVLIGKLISKSKNESWQGEVIDKKHNVTEDMDDKVTNSYFLVVKMDNGTERNVGLSPKMWDEFKIGDKIQKPKGKLYPSKV
jgi:hypothetical protein